MTLCAGRDLGESNLVKPSLIPKSRFSEKSLGWFDIADDEMEVEKEDVGVAQHGVVLWRGSAVSRRVPAST